MSIFMYLSEYFEKYSVWEYKIKNLYCHSKKVKIKFFKNVFFSNGSYVKNTFSKTWIDSEIISIVR